MLWSSLRFSLLFLWFASTVSLADPIVVTGNPASAPFLESVLRGQGWTQTPSRPLHPGETWRSPKGQRVINLDWSPPSAAVAALSDHSETVDRRGLLFSGGLTPLRPIRFQYYHLGALQGRAPGLELFMTNPGNQDAKLHLQKGVGAPSKDYFSTGHGNNVAWLQVEATGEGEFLTISAGETVVIFRQEMPKDYVVSGTLGLTQVEGPPLQFGLLAAPDPSDAPSLNNLLKETDVHSRGFYPVATQKLVRSYQAGDSSETRIAIGALRQETFSGVRELRGDYGVVYDLELHLHNPLDRPATIELLFNPRGGAATGTFMLDEKLVEVELTKAMEERAITRWQLPPSSHRRVRLQTIPEGASSYPVRLILREESR